MVKTAANDPVDSKNPPLKVSVIRLIMKDIATLRQTLDTLEKRVESLMPAPPPPAQGIRKRAKSGR